MFWREKADATMPWSANFSHIVNKIAQSDRDDEILGLLDKIQEQVFAVKMPKKDFESLHRSRVNYLILWKKVRARAKITWSMGDKQSKYFEYILAILRKQEFSYTAFNLVAENWTSSHFIDLQMLSSYLENLQETIELLQPSGLRIVQVNESIVMRFAGKVLAIAALKIPRVNKVLIKVVTDMKGLHDIDSPIPLRDKWAIHNPICRLFNPEFRVSADVTDLKATYIRIATRIDAFFLQKDNFLSRWPQNTGKRFFHFFEELVRYFPDFEAAENLNFKIRQFPGFGTYLDRFLVFVDSFVHFGFYNDLPKGKSKGYVVDYTTASRVESVMRLTLKADAMAMSQMLEVLFSYTNLYSLKSVRSCFILMNLIFNDVTKLGAEFDINLFYSRYELLLCHDHFDVRIQALRFLFKNLEKFQGDLRKDFLRLVIRNCFMKLFLDWSKEVRIYFHTLIVYKFLVTNREELHFKYDKIILGEVKHPKARQPTRQQAPRIAALDFVKKQLHLLQKEASPVKARLQRPSFTFHAETRNYDILIDNCTASKLDSQFEVLYNDVERVPTKNAPYLPVALHEYGQILSLYYSNVPSRHKETIPEVLTALPGLVRQAPPLSELNPIF